MLKTLGRETKGFRLVSVLTPIFMIAEVIMEMIIPKMMASIIDNGVTPGNMQVIYTVGAQMVVAALFGLPPAGRALLYAALLPFRGKLITDTDRKKPLMNPVCIICSHSGRG